VKVSSSVVVEEKGCGANRPKRIMTVLCSKSVVVTKKKLDVHALSPRNNVRLAGAEADEAPAAHA